MKGLSFLPALVMPLVLCASVRAQSPAFDELIGVSGPVELGLLPEPEAAASAAETEAFQYLPPDNDEP
ncbi:MAG: hypothetical protein RDU13_11395 [Elusimicrobiales bacterium]|nr:hypothetical protein [Elusimicrobiales bacterium]